MSLSEDDNSLPLSALQHWLFCPRQFALIHIEQLWVENQFTAEGRILHERADIGQPESRAGIRILRAVQLSSVRYGLHGVADVVEMHGDIPFPVEYKRGRPKTHRADEVQLCTQALCLEEMTGQRLTEGALFYGAPRRRKIVIFNQELRDLTINVANEIRTAITLAAMPSPVFDTGRCPNCSMFDLCQPRAARNFGTSWLARRIINAGVPE